MESIWFCLVAAMIAVYVILDGFDLGAGIVHLLVARTESERRAVIASIGPVWDGNEVWLLAGGGTLYFAFPALYASSFSGFYLPLMIVLWLLILRGMAVEFRNHVESLVWHPLWDAAFAAASTLLVVFFGAALGNVVRGVPLNAAGEFFLPLWTDFSAGPDAGILDWYTVVIAVAAVAAITVHGALWVVLKTEGELRERSRRVVNQVWWALLFLVVVITLCSFRLQPHLRESFSVRPWGYVFPLLAVVGLTAMRVLNAARQEAQAFLGSCLFLFGMLTSVAFGVYPYVLPSNSDPALSLSIYNAAAPHYGLQVGLYWFIPGTLLAIAYFVYTYWHSSGKVRV